MTDCNVLPKTNGDILYASDVNNIYLNAIRNILETGMRNTSYCNRYTPCCYTSMIVDSCCNSQGMTCSSCSTWITPMVCDTTCPLILFYCCCFCSGGSCFIAYSCTNCNYYEIYAYAGVASWVGICSCVCTNCYVRLEDYMRYHLTIIHCGCKRCHLYCGVTIVEVCFGETIRCYCDYAGVGYWTCSCRHHVWCRVAPCVFDFYFNGTCLCRICGDICVKFTISGCANVHCDSYTYGYWHGKATLDDGACYLTNGNICVCNKIFSSPVNSTYMIYYGCIYDNVCVRYDVCSGCNLLCCDLCPDVLYPMSACCCCLDFNIKICTNCRNPLDNCISCIQEYGIAVFRAL